VGLRNAHAVEMQALQLMQRRVDRIEHYPDVAQRLRAHLGETERQAERLERILRFHDSGASTVKDVALQALANITALGNAIAGDEIIKNTFANFAFENYEIAAYRSLIVLAEKQGDRKALPLLRASLREEEQMADFIERNLTKLTLTYAEREDRGRQDEAKI
jgi:ferritin-like metal-binding protein YciE